MSHNLKYNANKDLNNMTCTSQNLEPKYVYEKQSDLSLDSEDMKRPVGGTTTWTCHKCGQINNTDYTIICGNCGQCLLSSKVNLCE